MTDEDIRASMERLQTALADPEWRAFFQKEIANATGPRRKALQQLYDDLESYARRLDDLKQEFTPK